MDVVSDYMPTTDEVREAWPHSRILPAHYSPTYLPTVVERRAEFDRWLAAHDAEVLAEALRTAAGSAHDLVAAHAEDCDRAGVASDGVTAIQLAARIVYLYLAQMADDAAAGATL